MTHRRYQVEEHRRDERDKLITEHIGVAQRIARKVARRVPPEISADDLTAAALLGLTQAADRYDTTRNEPFVAFAERRIRGAVYDEMRRGDILPRRRRTAAKKVRRAIERLETSLGREPTDEEVAEVLGVSVAEYREELERLAHVSVVALERSQENEIGLRQQEAGPDTIAEKRQTFRRLRDSLDALPDRDRALLSLYYLEDLTYAEIGRVFEVSESRVCQLHARAITRVRAQMGPEEEEREVA
jgi:RNA polymerase sigma factor for flagellar operon FliA